MRIVPRARTADRLNRLIGGEAEARAAVEKLQEAAQEAVTTWARSDAGAAPKLFDVVALATAKQSFEDARRLAVTARAVLPAASGERDRAATAVQDEQNFLIDGVREVLHESAEQLRDKWRAARRETARIEGELIAIAVSQRGNHRLGEQFWSYAGIFHHEKSQLVERADCAAVGTSLRAG